MMSALSRPAEPSPAAEPLVEISGLTKLYPMDTGWLGKKRSWLSALEDVDLDVRRGEIRYEGKNIFALSRLQVRRLRRKVQIVFQDPYSSLNPRHTVSQIVGEGINGLKPPARRARIKELLELVGLSPNIVDRYPHEFSGGQRQRICIARALAVKPEFLILDEPVSALDVSVQSKILNLLGDLRDTLHLTYVLISHDLGVVRHIADRVAVLYLGHLVEVAPKQMLFKNPRHPYTQALLSAVPVISTKREKRTRIVLTGEIPTAIDIPARCRFATRCFRSIEVCWKEVPRLKPTEREHTVACFNHAPIAQALPR